MKNLISLIQKNFRLLLRARASALIIILGPLLVLFLTGIAFDNDQNYRAVIGTYVPDETPLAVEFVTNLKESDFRLVSYSSEENCVEGIYASEVHLCLAFSHNFSTDHLENNITFHADFSRLNLVYSILEAASRSVTSTTSSLSLNLTTELLNLVSDTKVEVTKKRPLLITMTTQNTKIRDSADTMESYLSELDVSFNQDSFQLSNLTLKGDDLSFMTTSLHTTSRLFIDETEDWINDIQVGINAHVPLQSDRENLTSILDEARRELDVFENQVLVSKSIVEQDVKELKQLTEEVYSSVNSTERKLNTFSDIRTSLGGEVDTIRLTLDKSLTGILDLQRTVNQIESQINQLHTGDSSAFLDPINTVVKPVTQSPSHFYYIFPVILVVLLMITCLLLPCILVVLDKKSKAHFRNFMTPTSDFLFLFSIFVTSVSIEIFQLFLVLVISLLFLGGSILSSFFSVLVVLLAGVLVFTLLGMVVGYYFESEETATLCSIALVAIFLLASDLILPLESMSPIIGSILQYNPFVITTELLRKTILYGTPLGELWFDFLWFFFFSVLLMVGVLFAYHLEKKRRLQNAFRRHKLIVKEEDGE